MKGTGASAKGRGTSLGNEGDPMALDEEGQPRGNPEKAPTFPHCVALPCEDRARWGVLMDLLLRPHFESFSHFEWAVQEVMESPRSLTGLREALGPDSEQKFISNLLPFIQSEAKSLPERCAGQRILVLVPQHDASIRLSRTLVSSLLACAFLNLFSRDRGHPLPTKTMPQINMEILLCHCPQQVRFLLNYFDRIKAEIPTGVVTVTRKVLSNAPKVDEWQSMSQPLTKMTVHMEGGIEDAHGMLEADFANMYIGGGVLNGGCVQEEIRFLLSPECIVSMLMCPRMECNEAIVIDGVERFSQHSGYMFSLAFHGSYRDTNKDEHGQPLTSIVAFDALDFRPMPCAIPAQYSFPHKLRELVKANITFKPSEAQYSSPHKLRELVKAYVAFKPSEGERLASAPIATGNWGCGEFLGCKHLKVALQWAAASAAGRPVHYFVFGDKKLGSFIKALSDRVQEAAKPVTVGDLITLIFRFDVDKWEGNGFLPWLADKLGRVAEKGG